MRSKFMQQIDVKVGVEPQTVTLSAGAATLKSPLPGVAHVGDNGTLGEIKSAYIHINLARSSSSAMTVTPTIYESADTTDGNFTAVTLKTGQTLPTVSNTSSAGAGKGFFIKVAGLKKYIRVLLTFAGTGTDTAIVSVVYVLGDGSVESLPRDAVATIYEKA